MGEKLVEQRRTVCRICHIACDLTLDIEAGRVKAVHGARDNPVYYGYSCIKGRTCAEVLSLPERLLGSMKRNAEGNFEPIASGEAIAQAAAKLAEIVARDGPRAVGMFVGTYISTSPLSEGFARALMRAIGSAMVFDNGTIDQPGKPMAMAMHGVWLAGSPPMDRWDALLLVGSNPIISMSGGLGVNPARTLKRARARGMRLVVIDPRRTECARQADVHLQIRPGEDAVVMAAIVREMLAMGGLDHAFVAAETQGLDALTEAVAPFTMAIAAARAGVDEADIKAAVELLAAAPRGAVSAGTGGNMSGQSTIVEYLAKVITSLRGWWLRAGEMRPNPGVLIEPMPAIAATPGPSPVLPEGETMRVRGLRQSIAGLPTGALAEEILTPGPGQIKALIVCGGNPLLAWPDQLRTRDALKALELLIVIDPVLSATARHAHYVLAPTLGPETETNTAVNERWRIVGPGWGYEVPYAQVCPPVLEPPPGADLREDWEFFYELARHMGLSLEIYAGAILDPVRSAAMATKLDMRRKPSALEAWRMVLKGSPVPYDEARSAVAGQVFSLPVETVAARPEGWMGRLELGAPLALERLAELVETPAPDATAYPYRLISRRLNDVMNSCWHENPTVLRKWSYNPAFLHPDDLSALGLEPGAVIEIRSERGTIRGVAQAEAGLRRGCVSMSHSWGRGPDDPEDPRADGGNTGRLVSNDKGFDPITGMPRMSAIPVSLQRV